MTNQDRPTAVDLFCGVGGMSLGFVQAGFNVVSGVDYNETALDSFRSNFPFINACNIDLSITRADTIRRLLGPAAAEIDVVFGGPPCQGFSLLGRRQRDDERNSLLMHFARIVSYLKPSYFVMENVEGILIGDAAHLLEHFCRRIRQAGYRLVEPVKALNAEDFGVPQRRRRVFMIGYRRGEPAARYPESCFLSSGHDSLCRTTVGEAISDLPEVDDLSELLQSDRYFGRLGTPSHYAEILRGEVEEIGVESLGRSVNGDGLGGCQRTQHTTGVRERFAGLRQGQVDKPSRSVRLRMNGVAPTLRAGTGPQHGSHTALRPIHPTSPRYITVREAARLHSFPDWFEFHPTKWHALMQIGNSVPPRLARYVAQELKRCLET